MADLAMETVAVKRGFRVLLMGLSDERESVGVVAIQVAGGTRCTSIVLLSWKDLRMRLFLHPL